MAARGARAAAGDAGDRVSQRADRSAMRRPLLAAFRQGLQRSRLRRGPRTSRSNTAGRRVNTIDCRRWRPIWSAAGGRDRSRPATRSALAAKAATTTIPIVFAPAATRSQVGLVASLNRPGGNVTGVNLFATRAGCAKRLELLRELVPSAARIAVLVNPSNTAMPSQLTQKSQAAAARARACSSTFCNAGTEPRDRRSLRDAARERPTRCS